MPRSLIFVLMFAVATAAAQQPAAPSSMGTVPTHDALVTGGLEVHGDSARLLTNTSITAYDHSAAISLARGGNVLVCATTQFHLLHSGTENSLLFGLDRGAIELHTDSSPQDVILTPDIRFTLEHPGRYDLRLRVTPNGDTCVDNAGASAPVLTLADPFSGASYRLIPGQHVLFEHGSLREVVDNERSPCGCPPAPAPVQQVASTPDLNPGQPATPAVAAAEHPFPAAASEGLAPTPAPAHVPETAGQPHTQVATVLSYDAAHPDAVSPGTVEPPAPAPATGSTTGSPTGTAAATSSAPPPTPPGAHDLVHALGHFFRKLFHPHAGTSPPPQQN
ncbi:MAG TPA: nuclease [Acidobacteriaceae bacterium]|nr:nuclease [Acidobacteriaceae bacterium]